MSEKDLDEGTSKGGVSRKRKLSDPECSLPAKKGAEFVDKHRCELIQKVRMVMPVVEELRSQCLLNEETQIQIRKANTDEEKMMELYKAMDEGGDKIKFAFYCELRDYEPHLFQDLDDDFCMEFEGGMMLQYKSFIDEHFRFLAEHNPSSGERVELAAFYTEPVIIQKTKEQTKKLCHQHMRSAQASGSKQSSQLLTNDKNHIIRIDQLFSPDCEGTTPESVILSGHSGRGKSIMLQKIMLGWASGELYSENFDAVFLLKCEELKCISDEISLNELLSWSCNLTPDQISQILELKPKKVLFLIDGVDEYVFNKSKDTIGNLLRGILLPESFILVATRSRAAAEVMNLLKGPLRFTEIAGFSERGVQEYFLKFFQDEQIFRKTFETVKRNEILLSFCSVPLLCWMVCCCLKKNFRDDENQMTELKTITSIYVHFVSTLLEDHDQRESLLTFLRSLGQLAEEGSKGKNNIFCEESVTITGLNPATSVFLIKDCLKKKNRQESVFRFMHLRFQEFFTSLYYVLLDKRKSNPEKGTHFPSVMMFLCGLVSMKLSCSLFKNINMTFSHVMELKMDLQERVLKMSRQHRFKMLVLHCLYELQDDRFVMKVLKAYSFLNLSNVPLKSTDCWVLHYCLQLRPGIRDLNLMHCELTAEKLRILQPALHSCERLRLSVEHLSEVGDLIQNLSEANILRQLKVQEDERKAESPRWSLDLTVRREKYPSKTSAHNFRVFLSSSEGNPSFPGVSNISFSCPPSQMSSADWKLFSQRLSKMEKLADDPSALANVGFLRSSFSSVGLKTLTLEVFSLNERWASEIISLIQTCTSLQLLSVTVTGLLLEEGLKLLNESLTDPHCTVSIIGRKCSKPTDQCREQDWSRSCNEIVTIHFIPKELNVSAAEGSGLNISAAEGSGLNPHSLPVCRSCVHIADSGPWVLVEPAVCGDERGSEFRISTPAGRFQCSRTTMRWVCTGDVTLQYGAVDGGFLSADLERLQYERIGPVIDVTVISGKLEEAHLPHYVCLAESDPSLTDAVKLLSVEDGGISLQSVELTRFHAKILQPTFSPKTLLMKLGISVKVHCDLLIFMILRYPIILHVYFFPTDSIFKETILREEESNQQIRWPRPETPLQMLKQHRLEVSGADVQPEAIMLRGDIEPNFFHVRQLVDENFNMTLRRVEDQRSVWTATVCKELTTIKSNNSGYNLCQTGQTHKTQDAANFDKVKFFDTHWPDLVQSIKNVNAIADKLLQNKIINEDLYSEITHPNSTSVDNMRKICIVVRTGSASVKEMFISILLEENPNLLDHLPLSDS